MLGFISSIYREVERYNRIHYGYIGDLARVEIDYTTRKDTAAFYCYRGDKEWVVEVFLVAPGCILVNGTQYHYY